MTGEDLVLLSRDVATAYSLEQPPPIGSREAVRRAISAAIPSVTFDGIGCRSQGGGCSLAFRLESSDPICEIPVTVGGRRTAAFERLRELCDASNLVLFDRATGRFLDLSLPDPLAVAVHRHPFQWWTGMPGWARVLIGLAVGATLLFVWLSALAAQLTAR